MKKRAVKGSSEEQKGFVWISLRISFYLMLFLLVLSFINNVIFVILSIFTLILSIFVIAISIAHLYKYKRKAFAIVTLVISVLSLLVVLLFYVGLVSELA